MTKRATKKDLGHGIGQCSWNDLRIDLRDAGRDGAVRELIARDVCGERMTRLDLDAGTVEGDGPWSKAQILEVATRCLASIGKQIGDPFGCFEEHTRWGLWNGRKPKWMDKADWQAVKAEAEQVAA